MKKGLKLLLGLSTIFGVGLAGVGFDKTEHLPVEAVSTTRLYIIVTDQLLTRAPAFKLVTGSGDVDLALLSTVDSRHDGDVYTYFTDATITNAMTLKNTGGSAINLYNISRTNKGITWDTIVWNQSLPGFERDAGGALYHISLHTSPSWRAIFS